MVYEWCQKDYGKNSVSQLRYTDTGTGWNTCYEINKNEKPFATLSHDRFNGADLVLDNSILWITGGDRNGHLPTLDTTEYVYWDGRVEMGPKLPRRSKKHCLVELGNDYIMLIGGMAQDYKG